MNSLDVEVSRSEGLYINSISKSKSNTVGIRCGPAKRSGVT
jgi:hypothetical protein